MCTRWYGEVYRNRSQLAGFASCYHCRNLSVPPPTGRKGAPIAILSESSCLMLPQSHGKLTIFGIFGVHCRPRGSHGSRPQTPSQLPDSTNSTLAAPFHTARHVSLSQASPLCFSWTSSEWGDRKRGGPALACLRSLSKGAL